MVSKTNELCPRCAQGKLVTDNESGEMFCSKCGFVITEKHVNSRPGAMALSQNKIKLFNEYNKKYVQTIKEKLEI